MRGRWKLLLLALSILFAGLPGGFAAAQGLPVVKGKKVVASVDGEPITLDAFNQEIAAIKKGLAPGEPFDKKAETDLLNRLINIRLIVLEAKNIGLDKQPEITKLIDAFSRESLREELAAKITKDVKADEKEVEKVYRESIQEWKISAILCDKEEDAKAAQAELQAGRSFSEVAKESVSNRRAKRAEDGIYLKANDADPQFGKVIASMAVGATSSLVQVTSGFAILRLEDIRYTEDPEEKGKVRQALLAKVKGEALRAHDDALKKQYVKVNREVLNSIDYEADTPGFEALAKDTRVVAEVKGDTPVTVRDLTEQLKYQFFHGVERAAEKKKLNARKEVALEGILHRKVFRKEALKLGLDKTESYRGKGKEYENSLLFGTFLSKVINPEIKLKEDEVKAYYNDHLKEYTTPEMMRIRSLVFAKRADAETAIEKLKEGAEFQWLAAHAEGQVGGNAAGILSFDGGMIITEDLPEGARKAIAGAKPGDSRLYASPAGHFYVLAIPDVASPKPQPYEQARQEIAQKIFEEKQKKAVEEYADKLRSLADVKVYLKN